MFGNWRKALSVYFDRRMLVMVLLGFSSGFPLLLVFGTLNLWLKRFRRSAGDDRFIFSGKGALQPEMGMVAGGRPG